MASLLIPAGIVAVALFAGKGLKEKLQRISVTNFRLKVGSIKLNEVLLQVTLDIYNPNTSQLVFGYFQGYIYRNGIRLGRFDFNATGSPMKFPGRSTTPATFNVRLTTAGIVANLFNILRNLHQQPANALNFSVDGILNVGGFDMPIKYEYNLKSGVAGIGKPYVKMEFGSNEEMQKYFRKPCSDHKFSLNGIPVMGIGAIQDKNYHVLKVTFLGPTNYRDGRVKIQSERFKESVTINYNHNYNNTKEVAANWLDSKGFNIIGAAESKDGYYIITDTFKSLKEK